MNREKLLGALESAFHAHVASLFGPYARGDMGLDEYVGKVGEAQKAHDAAAQGLINDGPGETDDDYRERMLPVAGDDAWRQRITDAKGPDLDRLGQHYNLARGPARPSIRPEDAAPPPIGPALAGDPIPDASGEKRDDAPAEHDEPERHIEEPQEQRAEQ